MRRESYTQGRANMLQWTARNRKRFGRIGRRDEEWVKKWARRPDLYLAFLKSMAGESLQSHASGLVQDKKKLGRRRFR